jgi:hypothetical protein
VTRRGADPFPQPRDGRNAREVLGVIALVHHMHDFIDEPVQTHEGPQVRGPLDGLEQIHRALFAKNFRVDHGEHSWPE